MSSLKNTERQTLEKFLSMSDGYVLNFSDRTLGEFVAETVGVDIHSDRYIAKGASKAKKLRMFWKLEPDQMVGKLLIGLIDYRLAVEPNSNDETVKLANQCRQIATRLLAKPDSAPIQNAPQATPLTSDPNSASNDKTLVDKLIQGAKNNRTLAVIIVFATVVIGLGAFFESIQKIAPTVMGWMVHTDKGDDTQIIVSNFLGVKKSDVTILNAEWFDFSGNGGKKELAVHYELPLETGFAVFSVRKGAPERLFQQQNIFTHGYIASYDKRNYLIVAVEGQGSGSYLDFGVFEWDGIGSPRRIFETNTLYQGQLIINDGQLYVRGNNQRFALKKINGEFGLVRYVARPKYPEMGEDSHILSFNIKDEQLLISFDGKLLPMVNEEENTFKTAESITMLKRDSIVVDDNLDEPRILRILISSDEAEWRPGFFSTIKPGATNRFELHVNDGYKSWYKIGVSVVAELPSRY